MTDKNVLQQLLGVINSPIAQRSGIILSSEHCKIWSEELTKYIQMNSWHPASELPPVDENGNSEDVIVICGTMNFHCDLPRWSSVVGGVWGDKDVKWWYYPPE